MNDNYILKNINNYCSYMKRIKIQKFDIKNKFDGKEYQIEDTKNQKVDNIQENKIIDYFKNI